jgi:hypothetical protein
MKDDVLSVGLGDPGGVMLELPALEAARKALADVEA